MTSIRKISFPSTMIVWNPFTFLTCRIWNTQSILHQSLLAWVVLLPQNCPVYLLLLVCVIISDLGPYFFYCIIFHHFWTGGLIPWLQLMVQLKPLVQVLTKILFLLPLPITINWVILSKDSYFCRHHFLFQWDTFFCVLSDTFFCV